MSKPCVFKFSQIASAAVFMAMVLVPAIGADSARVGAYDFSYTSAGDAPARPIQVFDDGRSTYLQFRPGMAVPAIFSTASGSPQILIPTQEGPYVRVDKVMGSMVLEMGRSRAQVIHAGGARPDAPELAVKTAAGREPYVPGSVYPQGAQLVASLTPVPTNMFNAPAVVDDRLQTNSYATPRKGDAVVWEEQAAPAKVEKDVWFSSGSASLSHAARNSVMGIAKSIPRGAKVVVIGREDESLKDGVEAARAKVIKEALVKAGVPAEQISTKLGVAGKQDRKLWASTIQIEGEGSAVAARPNNPVLDNLQNLVRLGVLRLDQAEAIARGHGMTMGGTQVAAAAPAPAAVPVAARAATSVAGAPSAPVTKTWDMRKADGTVDKMFSRWASEAGWTVVWKDAPAIQVTGDTAMPASDFLTAADTVIRRAQEAGWHISAAAYTNQTLVVTPKK